MSVDQNELKPLIKRLARYVDNINVSVSFSISKTGACFYSFLQIPKRQKADEASRNPHSTQARTTARTKWGNRNGFRSLMETSVRPETQTATRQRQNVCTVLLMHPEQSVQSAKTRSGNVRFSASLAGAFRNHTQTHTNTHNPNIQTTGVVYRELYGMSRWLLSSSHRVH